MQFESRDLSIYRRLIILAGIIYLLWWGAVELLLPEAYNPIGSRISVVAIIFTLYGLSFWSAFVRNRIRFFYLFSVWLITLHYYYLFYENAGAVNWIIGSYITIIAINISLFTYRALLSYSVFVMALSLGVAVLVPSLESSVFLPGLITILLQANLGFRTRLRLLNSVAESNQLFQNLFHSAFEGIFVHHDRRILNVNQSLADIFGYRPEELMGKDAMDFILPEQRGLVAQKIESDDEDPYETVGVVKGGATIEIEVRAKNIVYQRRPARLVAIQNITDRKKAERNRILMQAMTENVRVRDEFISIASHELKTPLTSLKLQTQMLEYRARHGEASAYSPESMNNFISLVNRQTQRLTKLVELMLDVSRIKQGRLDLQISSVNISALVHEVVNLLKTEHTDSLPIIRIEGPSEIYAHVDPDRFEQVIENLLMNAIKYGDSKPIEVKLAVEGAELLFIVKDHGLGIAPEFVDRIFNRFERAISPKHISGLGLGLYITRQIVEAHGGTITVESELGRGSVFTVRVPLTGNQSKRSEDRLPNQI